MTDAEEVAPVLPKEDPEKLVLRGRPRPVVRFWRGLIIGLTGTFAAILLALSWIALEPPTFRKAANSEDSPEPAREAGPEALANAPKSYGDVPRLGPPLPVILDALSWNTSEALRRRHPRPSMGRSGPFRVPNWSGLKPLLLPRDLPR